MVPLQIFMHALHPLYLLGAMGHARRAMRLAFPHYGWGTLGRLDAR